MNADRRRRPLAVEEADRAKLEQTCRAGGSAQRDVLRARIVLLAAAGASASEVAERLGVRKATVLDWVGRFRAHGLAALVDAPRSGRPRKHGEQVRLQVAALAVDDPGARNIERSRWTVRAVAAELARTGGKSAPRRSTVWEILRDVGIRTNRSEFWLFSKDPEFEAKVNAIAPLLASPSDDELVISLDEKTSIQALSRPHPNTPPAPGRSRRVEHGYKRHGTVDLIAGYVPTTGEVFGLVADTHTHAEFGEFLRKLLARFSGKVALLMDNLSVHKHAKIKELLAGYGDRVRVLFTPTHASWLNPIEAWFSILSRRALRDRHFMDKDALTEALYEFIDYWNAHDKQPLRWHFRGFPAKRPRPDVSAVGEKPHDK